jgi:8-oxo-dGTP pyrophosphatase MutT (NUDIX family)
MISAMRGAHRGPLSRLLAPPVGRLVRFVVDGEPVGFVTPDRADRLEDFAAFAATADTLSLACAANDRTAAMAEIAGRLAREGALRVARRALRRAHAVRRARAVRARARAARYFGIRTYAAHVNGLVHADDGIRMWLARRSATKSIDPGLLDNLVGGGIASGATVDGRSIKESWEEAGIAAEIAARAVNSAELTIFRQQPDGIQHETIYAHDLWLPADWTPANQDGELWSIGSLPLADVARIIAADVAPDVMTADASLVAFDCLSRLHATALC